MCTKKTQKKMTFIIIRKILYLLYVNGIAVMLKSIYILYIFHIIVTAICNIIIEKIYIID